MPRPAGGPHPASPAAAGEGQYRGSLAAITDVNKLAGKTALVIGASRGIGRAMAVGFAQEGADIIGLARNIDALERLADEVRGYGRQAHVRHFDVFDPNAYPELMLWLDENALDFDIVAHLPGGGTFILAET